MNNKYSSLDTVDYKVLSALMNEGRITWAELGDLLKLSPPAAADRVRRLEEKGIIKGYAALLNPEQINCEVTAFIGITLNHPDYRAQFLDQLLQLPSIQECHHVAGEDDYLIKVRCFRMSDLESLISDFIKKIPGVGKTKTTIVLSTIKETPNLPLPL